MLHHQTKLDLKSPLTYSKNVAFLEEIDMKLLVERYQIYYKMDITRFFKDIPKIEIYKCLDTGFDFFYPFNLAGDADFYDELQQNDWYNQEWKGEHQIVAHQFKKEKIKVLEIGASVGNFLRIIQNDYAHIEICGLEMNEKVVQKAQQNGLNIINESVEQHVLSHQNYYDVVCSFQVLEHIIFPIPFLEANIQCLKKGGKLFCAVPNNDSAIRFTNSILNMPPHHLGLWKKKSLESLVKLLPIRLVKFHYEPLQENYKIYYKKAIFNMRELLYQKRVKKYGQLGRVINKIMRPFDVWIAHLKSPTFKNITIIAEFEKL